MAHVGKSFDELSQVVNQIAEHEVRTAIGLVRKQRAGLNTDIKPHRLHNTISQLDPDELSWLDAVLCVRSQQAGREAAWRRFAESAYREMLPGGPTLVTGEAAKLSGRDARRPRRAA